jgi:hypothetical protein
MKKILIALALISAASNFYGMKNDCQNNNGHLNCAIQNMEKTIESNLFNLYLESQRKNKTPLLIDNIKNKLLKELACIKDEIHDTFLEKDNFTQIPTK